MVIRSSIARRIAGGPPFRVDPSRIIVEPDHQNKISNISELAADEATEIVDKAPVPDDFLEDVSNKLIDVGFGVKKLNNTGLLVAEADQVLNVIEQMAEEANTFENKTIRKLETLVDKASRAASNVKSDELDSNMMFSSDDSVASESVLRERLTDLSLKNDLTDAIEEINGVASAYMSYSPGTFGPRNLNVDIMDPVKDVAGEERSDLPNLNDAVDKIGASNVWGETRGEDAVVAVLDTSFNSDYFSDSRVLDTFAGTNTDGAFAKPEEGHGTMSAYTAAGNEEENDLTVSGAAPDADLLLARTTDSTGALKNTEEAWDWLVGKIKDLDKPVLSNHSYGTPLCSARVMNLCENPTTKVVKTMNKRDDHQAFYAAGNEGLYCGHRLSGVTNGINGPNSLPSSISVGALRFDLREAQSYTSHGFGTCSSFMENPKPDVSTLIPSLIPYGEKVKDMSNGRGGSTGGTSDASPLVCGSAALLASKAGTASNDVIGNALENTAMLPRVTQINIIQDFDARFGNGQIQVEKALSEVQ